MATKPTDDDGWGELGDVDKDDEKPSAVVAKAPGEINKPSAKSASSKRKFSPSDKAKASRPAKASTPRSSRPSDRPTPNKAVPSAATQPSSPASDRPASSSSTDSALADPQGVPADESWIEPPASSLSDAVGDEPHTEPDKPKRPPLFSPKTRNRLVLLAMIGSIIGALTIVSWLNSRHLYLSCGETTVRAERGRFFPWGRTNLPGDRWKPIEPGSQCVDRELGTIAELEKAFLDLALSHASKNLAAVPPADLNRAAALLDQAELLARAPERSDERDDIKRLSHDIEYWRASSDVDAAIMRLVDAQKKFKGAAGRTRHTSDAGERAAFLAELLDAIKRGNIATTPADEPNAVPIDPTANPILPPNDAIDAIDAIDAGVATSTLLPAEVDAAPSPKPAPIPSGGVLL